MAIRDRILEFYHRSPGLSAQEIANEVGCKAVYVRSTLCLARKDGANIPRLMGKAGRQQSWTDAETDILFHLREIEERSWSEIGKCLRRTTGSCFSRYHDVLRKRAPATPFIPKSDIPASVIDDAGRRASAPRTLTALFFGDPPPGQSALDRMAAR